jgi:UDP-N-acetylmuramate dehydrogenase
MARVCERVTLAGYTTLGLGGPAARFIEAGTDEEIITAVREADLKGDPLLVLGGGSNLVVADEGFAGTVIRIASRGIRPVIDGAAVLLAVEAGEQWDPLVEQCVGEELSGLECLSGIPGLAGATPIQNVGAYGQDVAETLVTVRAYDRQRDVITELANAECDFGYRTSAFKRGAWPSGAWPDDAGPGGADPDGADPDGAGEEKPGAGEDLDSPGAAATGRFVVLGVTFRLERNPLSAPVRYAELAARLGVPAGERVPLTAARDAVLGLRRAKGMVLDPQDPDTRSAGSFFTNPVLDQDQFAQLERTAAARSGHPVSIPHFAGEQGRVKVPAAWLIEQAGFGKGYPTGAVARISSKHTLALTNPGGATTADLLALARQIIAGVQAAFGIRLANEPVLVGVTV